jgi:hypothetical protein
MKAKPRIIAAAAPGSMIQPTHSTLASQISFLNPFPKENKRVVFHIPEKRGDRWPLTIPTVIDGNTTIINPSRTRNERSPETQDEGLNEHRSTSLESTRQEAAR